MSKLKVEMRPLRVITDYHRIIDDNGDITIKGSEELILVSDTPPNDFFQKMFAL